LAVTEQDVRAALRAVRYPGFTRDIVSLGIVREVRVEHPHVQVTLDLELATGDVHEPLREAVRRAVGALEGVSEATVRLAAPARAAGSGLRMVQPANRSVAAAGSLDPGLIPGVRHALAVASGKGGVGKSTVAVNLSVALAQGGLAVGLLDADIYGPSIPLMMGVHGRPRPAADGRAIVPFEHHGVRFMSLGFLVDPDSPVIWRGPMVMKAIEQLLRDVEWGTLDVLVVDLPPGTGDAQLTLSQRVRLSGAVIVTTPQDVALADAIKGVNMFRRVGVPVLGIVENMSFFTCPHCGARAEIFGSGGGKREALRLGVPLLGEIALEPAIRAGGDSGRPIVAFDPGAPSTAAFRVIASRILSTLHEAPAEAARGTGLLERFRKRFGI
jgi:ATP-binding protein involved in chromosome partitioning